MKNRDKVKERKPMPCGCTELTYSDGRKAVLPCVPHAIREAGAALASAGNMLGHVSEQLMQEQKDQVEQAMGKIIGKVGNK